jgi:hypothetical protein
MKRDLRLVHRATRRRQRPIGDECAAAIRGVLGDAIFTVKVDVSAHLSAGPG